MESPVSGSECNTLLNFWPWLYWSLLVRCKKHPSHLIRLIHPPLPLTTWAYYNRNSFQYRLLRYLRIFLPVLHQSEPSFRCFLQRFTNNFLVIPFISFPVRASITSLLPAFHQSNLLLVCMFLPAFLSDFFIPCSFHCFTSQSVFACVHLFISLHRFDLLIFIFFI